MATSWACDNVRECSDPTWTHVQYQVLVALAPMCVLALTGVFLDICLKSQMPHFRTTLAIYKDGVSSQNRGSALIMFVAYGAVSVMYAMKTYAGYVDRVYLALEMCCVMVIAVDVLFRWARNVTLGTRNLIKDVFTGELVLDCLIVSGPISLFVPGKDGRRTWFSFSFLAVVRLMRIVAVVQAEDTLKVAWRRQILYSLIKLLLYVYACGSTLMALEMLGPWEGSPVLNKEPGVTRPWSSSEAATYGFATFALLGATTRPVYTLLGQITSSVFVLASVYQLFKVARTLVTVVLGTGFYGKYKPKSSSGQESGHLVVAGSATGLEIREFLTELYHANHFDGSLHFDRNAPDTVILLGSVHLLSEIGNMLQQPNARLYRSKVHLFQGDPFKKVDQERAAIRHARRIVVLNRLGVAEPYHDDASNIMRALALSQGAPKVSVICVIHGSELRPGRIHSAEGRIAFVGMDTARLALLGKASALRGSMTFICNLMRSMQAEGGSSKVPWQLEYESSIGIELYEVPLQSSYHQVPFGEVWEDVLLRNKGTVQLIGLALPRNRRDEDDLRDILLNPGPDYPVEAPAGAEESSKGSCDKRTYGIFLAQDISAIRQAEPGEDLVSGNLSVPPQWAEELRAARAWGGQRPWARGRARVHPAEASDGGTFSEPASSPSSPTTSKSPNSGFLKSHSKSSLRRAVTKEMQEEAKRAKNKTESNLRFEQSLQEIRAAMMKTGLPPDLIFNTTGLGDKDKVKAASKDQAWDIPREPLVESQANSPISAKAKSQATADEMHWLERLEKVHEKVMKEAVSPTPLPRDLSGHLLLCLVGSTTIGDDLLITNPLTLGPAAGLNSFMLAAWDQRAHVKEAARPSIVVLAQQLPEDWSDVAEIEQIYYVRGSPLCLADLYRARFHHSFNIVVAKQSGGGHLAKQAADTQVILAATLIERNLPTNSPASVITAHTYAATTTFLPKPVVKVEGGRQSTQTESGISAEIPPIMQALLGRSKQRKEAEERVALRPGHSELSCGDCEEKYDELEGPDYGFNPRYIAGEAFISSALIGLIANAVYNTSLLPIVQKLITAPFFLLPLPEPWEMSRFLELAWWLFAERGLLAVGLYRAGTASEAAITGIGLNEKLPTHHFVYTLPDAGRTVLVKSDHVFCLLPTVPNAKAPPARSFRASVRNSILKQEVGDEDVFVG